MVEPTIRAGRRTAPDSLFCILTGRRPEQRHRRTRELGQNPSPASGGIGQRKGGWCGRCCEDLELRWRPSNRKRCSFCGRRDEVVEHLVRGRSAIYICDRCVAQANEAIAAAPAGAKMLRIRPTPSRVPDRDGAELAIEQAFETLFNPDLSVNERCAAIAGGGNLAGAMQTLNDRYPSSGVDVSVQSIRFVSADEAEVHFVLFLAQFPSGLERPGHAVLVGQDWKVTRDTWCDLARMGGVECPPAED